MSRKMITEEERIEWCNSFDSSRKWFNTIQFEGIGSKHTLLGYSRALYNFCEWMGKNPNQLIAERENELKNPKTKHNGEDKVTEFCLMLERERGIRKITVVTKYFAPLKSFYRYNNVSLTLRTPKYASRRREPHTKEEVRALMGIADVRERAIIMLLKDSGISRQDVVKLTYGDIKEEFEAGEKFIHLRLVREKEQIEHDTFIGENAVQYLTAYLNYRKNLGEKITKDTPLISSGVQGKAIGADGLSQVFVRLGEKANIKTSPHRFRKFFEGHIGLSAPSILVKYWMGHSLGVESSYFIVTKQIEQQREKYQEAYKELDISEKPTMSELKIKQLIALEQLKQTIAKEKHEELERLVLTTQSSEELDRITENIRSGKEELEPLRSHDCQKIIEESELEEWLAKGFYFVSVLPSGKILVSND